MSNRDTLFSSPISRMEKWNFNEQIATVFPDMVYRSIPGYHNIISMIGMLARRFVQSDTQVYDLGCSLGAAALSVQRNIKHKNCKIIAVDNSPAMIESFRNYVKLHKKAHYSVDTTSLDIVEGDIRNINILNASIVILNFTLQFLKSDDKQKLLHKIYHGLNPGGILVLSEKFSFENTKISKLLCSMHHDFKRSNGYSELEINQKYNLLKYVMFNNSLETHKARLRNAGFFHMDLWFQFFNFGSLVALKDVEKI